MNEAISVPLDFRVGNSVVVDDDLPPGPGYVRLATLSCKGEETFRCFTNPTCIKSAVPDQRRLPVSCVGWSESLSWIDLTKTETMFRRRLPPPTRTA